LNQAICAANLGFQQPLTLYVYAELQGGSVGGIRGAEYSIAPSVVTDWLFNEDFTPAGADIEVGTGAITGAAPGINLAWAACQVAPATLLETITVLDLSGVFAGVENTLTVSAHSNPGNPFFRCPLFTLWDDPTFTKLCVGYGVVTDVCPFPPGANACFYSISGQFVVNPPEGYNCTVGVQDKTWSEVKNLYN